MPHRARRVSPPRKVLHCCVRWLHRQGKLRKMKSKASRTSQCDLQELNPNPPIFTSPKIFAFLPSSQNLQGKHSITIVFNLSKYSCFDLVYKQGGVSAMLNLFHQLAFWAPDKVWKKRSDLDCITAQTCSARCMKFQTCGC